MGNDLERSSRGLLQVLSQYFSGGTEETTTNFSQYSRCPSRDSNQTPPEYKSESVRATGRLFCSEILWQCFSDDQVVNRAQDVEFQIALDLLPSNYIRKLSDDISMNGVTFQNIVQFPASTDWQTGLRQAC
jgi:hypothetical protein